MRDGQRQRQRQQQQQRKRQPHWRRRRRRQRDLKINEEDSARRIWTDRSSDSGGGVSNSDYTTMADQMELGPKLYNARWLLVDLKCRFQTNESV